MNKYKIEDIIKLVKNDLTKVREIIQDNPNLFKDEIKNLISKQKLEGIRFGRCYINDNEIKDMLYEIADNNSLDLFKRIQALYEILTEKLTPEKLKKEWINFLTSNLDEVADMYKKAYGIRGKKEKEDYFNKLVHEKIPKTPTNKKWVYLIELVALFKEKEETKEILNERRDIFLRKAAEKCSKYLDIK